MDIGSITSDLAFQITGMSDVEGKDFNVFSLDDLGEVFLRAPNGQFFKLTVEEVETDDISFIDEDDWS